MMKKRGVVYFQCELKERICQRERQSHDAMGGGGRACHSVSARNVLWLWDENKKSENRRS